MNSTNKILVVAPSWVGDMVMAQTLFILLKQHQPNCTLHVLAPKWCHALLERMPEVDQAIVSPFKHGELALRERFRLGISLRAEQYDQAILLPNSWKSALVPFWAKIPKRTGWVGESRYGVLNDIRKLDKKKYAKMTQRFAALAFADKTPLPKVLPVPRFAVQDIEVVAAMQKHGINVTDKPILALCPGSEFGSSKRWPPRHFAESARAKQNEGWDVWLFGSANDTPIASDIVTRLGGQCENLVGKTSLSEAVDLLSRVDAVITNDSGLMHIAAAFDKPLVVPYGSTSPNFTPPLTKQAKILSLNLACSPCFKRECPLQHNRCMEDLLPDQALCALSELVAETEVV